MIKQVGREEFSRACASATPAKIEVIVHHFFSPWAKEYRGRKTWQGVENYHVQARGFSDIGYDVGVWQEETWLLRDTDGSGFRGHLRAGGAHCIGHNHKSLGIVLAGNFDEEDPRNWGYDTLVWAIAEFLKARDLPVGSIHFHREFANKTCPGTRMNLTGLRGDVAEVLGRPAEQPVADVVPGVPRLRVVVGSDAIDEALPKLEEGHLYVLAEELCRHLRRNVPEGVAVHESGYTAGRELLEALGLVLNYRRTAQGHRWYVTWPE